MANCLPFNAVYDGENYDRVYKAEDWAWYFATFIANGIFPKPSDGLQVIAYSGMEIKVNAGFAFINGYAFKNPASHSIRLDMAEGALNRVDRVVVRWDLPQRDIYIAVLKGTPSAKPQPTAVTRSTEIWELALADIYVGKGVTKIQTKDITALSVSRKPLRSTKEERLQKSSYKRVYRAGRDTQDTPTAIIYERK